MCLDNGEGVCVCEGESEKRERREEEVGKRDGEDRVKRKRVWGKGTRARNGGVYMYVFLSVYTGAYKAVCVII